MLTRRQRDPRRALAEAVAVHVQSGRELVLSGPGDDRGCDQDRELDKKWVIPGPPGMAGQRLHIEEQCQPRVRRGFEKLRLQVGEARRRLPMDPSRRIAGLVRSYAGDIRGILPQRPGLDQIAKRSVNRKPETLQRDDLWIDN